MNQVLEFFEKLFETADWPPRWHCGNWTEFHGWFYIISDLLIWSAYFAIPVTILRYITRKTNLQFTRTYFLFAAFILACGSTHLLDAVTFWFPAYRLNALVRFITGVVSWITVFHLVKMLPVVSKLRTHAELEREIEERKRVEDQLRMSNQLLNEAQDIARMGSWQWNVPDNTISCSEGLYKLYNLPVGTKIELDLIIGLLHPEDKERMKAQVQRVLQEQHYPTFTYRIVRENSEVRILQAKGDVFVKDGSVQQVIGTVQDITEQQQQEQQILEKTKDLETLNEELQRFAYVASHDLQEPLRKILTFSSLLDKELNSQVNDKGRMYMEKIAQASTRMQSLIEDILQFSRVKSNPDAFATCDLNHIINQVISDMEIQVAQSGASIHVDPLPVIEAIPSQMGQLFQNLLSNAVKFQKPGVPPVVEVRCDELYGRHLANHYTQADLAGIQMLQGWEHQPYVCITIRDNGIGFDNTYADKVFEIFQRLHGKMYSGTGIGLAICKKIVDNHHGSIAARSEVGKGATFTVILPKAQKDFLEA